MSRKQPLRSRWLALTVVIALAAGGHARAGVVVNGGFETNDFTGWSTLGNASVVDALFQTGPVSGNFQALISSGPGSAGAGSLETFLNLTPGTLTGLGAVQGSGLAQNVSLNAGEVLTFTTNFLTSEDPTASNHNNDFAFVALTPTSTTGSPTVLASVDTTPLVGSFSQFVFESGFFQVAIPVAAAGSYTLGFGVADRGDTFVESGLLVDSVSTVPEPSSLTLLALAVPLVSGYWLLRHGRAA